MNGMALVVFLANLAAFLRILTYRPNGARHRPLLSWVAWALAVSVGGSAIELALRPRVVSLFDMGSAVMLMLFVIAARGNVAWLLGRK
ncbi:hypothetical protein JOE11_003721 [Robbsia andropogonis]|uniref:phage holin family protein n=1 Tax=Robbsia andropogonis TaxID=28092 RepID=UPI003D1B2955